jgi:hypothetical protein
MPPDRGHRRERMGDRFDYRRWAADGFHLYDDNEVTTVIAGRTMYGTST